jgi:hypothetical protein
MPTSTTSERRIGGRPRGRRERVIFSVGLRPEQAEKLRDLSEARDIPASTLLRQFVDRLLTEGQVAG